ncbi:MAG: IS200/IS605 family transposase [Phycisphaerales bacterium]|nr:IS200/IS605 family transposase [Phycisphaerales bacterium]MCB9862804.1 IS200/IS605 family transposase [Phycisphaerales bacterium]
MSQSLSNLHIHLIFSTKHREPLIANAIRDEMHAYMATVLKGLNCAPQMINSVDDHVHALFDLSRTHALSDVIKDVKASSSKWIKAKGDEFRAFAWQAGYGAFAVSESNVASVVAYIKRQEEHHRTRSFQDEFRLFLKRHRIEFDERYVWD